MKEESCNDVQMVIGKARRTGMTNATKNWYMQSILAAEKNMNYKQAEMQKRIKEMQMMVTGLADLGTEENKYERRKLKDHE